MIPMILLHVMTILTSLFWVLRVTFLKDIGLTEIEENDSKEMLHDKNENNSLITSPCDMCNQLINKAQHSPVLKRIKKYQMKMLNILVNGAIINSKIKTEWNSTGNLSMKLSDTHVKCVIKKRKKSLISCSIIQGLWLGKIFL